MPDTFDDTKITSIERFSHLEDRIFRVVEIFKSLKKENNFLRRENMALKEDILKFKQELENKAHHLDRLQHEREEIKNRVKRVLNTLSMLEQR